MFSIWNCVFPTAPAARKAPPFRSTKCFWTLFFLRFAAWGRRGNPLYVRDVAACAAQCLSKTPGVGLQGKIICFQIGRENPISKRTWRVTRFKKLGVRLRQWNHTRSGVIQEDILWSILWNPKMCWQTPEWVLQESLANVHMMIFMAS